MTRPALDLACQVEKLLRGKRISERKTLSGVKILIADDHEVVCEGTRLLIERQPGWHVCGIANTGREAVELAQKLRPDIAVLDMTMPDLNGLDAARLIKRSRPETEILIFTASDSDELIRDVFAAGAKSYIRKTDAAIHLVAALTALAEHKPFFTSKASEAVFAGILSQDRGSQSASGKRSLTVREREIVQLLAEGKSNKEVAATLGISVKTVETHRAAIMRKLSFESFSDLVRYAIRKHMIDA